MIAENFGGALNDGAAAFGVEADHRASQQHVGERARLGAACLQYAGAADPSCAAAGIATLNYTGLIRLDNILRRRSWWGRACAVMLSAARRIET